MQLSSGTQLHLAQLNIGTLRHPIDHADTAAFVDGLAPVNAEADAAPGFVWRLQTEEGNATSIHAFPDQLTIANLSVWQSIDDLRDFIFRGVHRDFLRRRADWFQPGSRAAMWWVPAGTVPTLAEALARLAFFERFGATAHAFGMADRFPTLVVVRTPLADPIVAPMLARLDAELVDGTPEGGSNFMHIAAEHVEKGNGAFFVAHHDGVPRACGAYRRIEGVPGAAEVKRMWADPEARGAKLGAATLATIEAAAIADGFTELRLETGEHFTAAVGLYRTFGFTQCESWGEYAGVPFSYCMSKHLG
ncbi:MAG: GNAT family N-acetyltransferase [Actinomycetota bacterium]